MGSLQSRPEAQPWRRRLQGRATLTCHEAMASPLGSSCSSFHALICPKSNTITCNLTVTCAIRHVQNCTSGPLTCIVMEDRGTSTSGWCRSNK